METNKKEIIVTKKINNDEMVGVITFAALTYPQRIAISQESISEVVDEGSLVAKANNDLSRAQKYYELAMKQVRTLELKIIDGEDITITSIDELMVYEQGVELVMKLASDLIGGIKLGNVKSHG